MNVKTENLSSRKIPKIDALMQRSLSVLPAEHLRGFTKIVVVDSISEPRLSSAQRATLPALYHPKMPGQPAWGEIALSVLLPVKRFPKGILSRLTMKQNIAQLVIALAGQHYHLTLAKGTRKDRLETACRLYAEKYFNVWREREGGLRMRLTKPFRPFLDRLAKRASKMYQKEMEKQRKGS